MYCNQCEETIQQHACTAAGVCGKKNEVANLQDLLLYVLKGISQKNLESEEKNKEAEDLIIEGLFSTITNVNFDPEYFKEKISEGIRIRNEIQADLNSEAASWELGDDLLEKAGSEDVRIYSPDGEGTNPASLKQTLLFGTKGIAAYAYHAKVLGYEDQEINEFMQRALAATLEEEKSPDELLDLVLECGEKGVATMKLLDKAHTENYGEKEPTEVNLGTGEKPGILITGHDLKDLELLLEQTKNEGIDVYTHGEMLPAQYYPYFKQYEHFKGNYGNSWWKQKEEFDKFNGAILATTNCLVPPSGSYKDRVFTTGPVGFPGLTHIGQEKDFSKVIQKAKECNPPEELESGSLVGGFGHQTLSSLKETILQAVEEGKISKFVVMAGCDGRHKEREYYTEFAKQLPEDTVILTAGCAKYRYNKLDLGTIKVNDTEIPRVIDAGQCNDSYSLVAIALELADALDVDVNELPIVYNIAWYEQKAVLVLLALLHLGIQNIVLGPRLPAFVNEDILNILVEKYNIRPNNSVQEDLEKMI